MKKINIRIDQEILEKIKLLARENNLSTNELMMDLIRKGTSAFEEKHGKIPWNEKEKDR